MGQFAGQVVAVTGAGRGLGAAYAKLLADQGASVLVHDAGVDHDGSGGDPAVAQAVAEEITHDGGRAVSLTRNLLDPDACDEVVETALSSFGRLDALVHNAGLVIWEDTAHPSDEAWSRTMAVNADAGFRLIRRALEPMRANGYGRIVVTTSGRATDPDGAAPGLVSYAAAKMAVLGLMVGFRANVREHDIHLNAISPVAATRVLRRSAPGLTPESVAPAVAWLCSAHVRESGLIVEAAGGRFSLARFTSGHEVDLGGLPSVEAFTQWRATTTANPDPT